MIVVVVIVVIVVVIMVGIVMVVMDVVVRSIGDIATTLRRQGSNAKHGRRMVRPPKVCGFVRDTVLKSDGVS